MSDAPTAQASRAGRRMRQGALIAAVVILAVTPLLLWSGSTWGGAERLVRIANGAPLRPDEDSSVQTVARTYYDAQYTALLVVIGLTVFATRGLYPVIWRLSRRGLGRTLIAVEAGFLLWVVYGGLSEVGMPWLFWSASPRAQCLAGLGVTLFLYWMLYLLFVSDYDMYRRQPERRIWSRFLPVLEESGLPALLRVDVAQTSGAAQMTWFLAYAGIPLLAALILPALLPAVRPGYLTTVIAAPWLAGVVIAVALIAAVVRWRIATRAHEFWRQVLSLRFDFRLLRDLDPERLDSHATTQNMLAVIVIVFLASYIAPLEAQGVLAPAFSVCFLLGVVATVVIWVGSRRSSMRVLLALIGLGLVAMAGVLDYDVKLRDLRDHYPKERSQLLRRITPGGFPSADYRKAVANLRDYQKNYPVKAHAVAHQERERWLKAWSQSFAGQGGAAPKKPIVVVVTTSGGALRAALWTETVLRALDAKIPDFHRNVRLISGASGGMLGAAHYVASHADGHAPDRREIRSDYLTPIAWRIAFRDFIPNGFIPVATYNRGDRLEDAWLERAGNLAHTFADLIPKERSGLIPSLVFSPMLVEDGRRLLISNLPLGDLTSNLAFALIEADRATLVDQFEKDRALLKGPAAAKRKTPDEYALEFPGLASVSAVEFFPMLGEKTRAQLRLAAAVRMSATFPYMTSVVALPTYPPRHVVDAGYYDNYGVNLAAAWISSHRKWFRDNTAGVLVIQIRAFRNEKRLKVLDEEIHSTPAPASSEDDFASVKHRLLGLAQLIPTTVSLVGEGIQSLLIPVEGVAKARESSMFFRNDEQLLALAAIFHDLTGDPTFFRSVIFTCDTLQAGRSAQNVETLNWYIDPEERRQVDRNMEPLNAAEQTGRDRNDLRLRQLLAWWRSRNQ